MNLETGEQVKRWRERAHITQQQLADEIGKSRNLIGSWERGIKKPPAWLRVWFIGYTRSRTRQPPAHIRNKIVEAYQSGAYTKDIATEFGVGRQYPARLAKKLASPWRPFGWNRNTPSPKVKDKIVAAYLAGEKAEVIAAEFGVNRHYASVLVKRRGLPVRTPGRQQRSLHVY